jgi:LacI family transcriptional regulator
LHFCYAKTSDDFDYNAAVTHLRTFLRELPKPCAVFLGGMHCANIVYRACELERIGIPHELSILTNDDDPLICETFQPQLSGIAGEINHIGLALAKMLDVMMSDPSLDPAPVIVPPEKIITRQSTDVLAVSHLPTARAIGFIFENYAKLIGVEEVSRHAGISLNALHKHFRDHVGKVPSDFLREVRMNRAKELLEETNLTLEQIAKQTGYSCAMSFYTAFKRLFHMTPGAYRSQSLPNRSDEEASAGKEWQISSKKHPETHLDRGSDSTYSHSPHIRRPSFELHRKARSV